MPERERHRPVSGAQGNFYGSKRWYHKLDVVEECAHQHRKFAGAITGACGSPTACNTVVDLCVRDGVAARQTEPKFRQRR